MERKAKRSKVIYSVVFSGWTVVDRGIPSAFPGLGLTASGKLLTSVTFHVLLYL